MWFDTIGEYEAKLNWINEQLGYPSDQDIQTYATLTPEAIDGKYYMPIVIGREWLFEEITNETI